jgi:hypothetical protein
MFHLLPRCPSHIAAQRFLARHLHNPLAKLAIALVTSPLTPWRTMNRGPPLSVTTAGAPHASASCTTLPNVSVCDGNANMSMFA